MALKSEKAKQHKKEYNQEYNKKTNYAAQRKYLAERSKQVAFRVFSPQDDALISWLESQPNKSGYIKDLIRADMEQRKIK